MSLLDGGGSTHLSRGRFFILRITFKILLHHPAVVCSHRQARYIPSSTFGSSSCPVPDASIVDQLISGRLQMAVVFRDSLVSPSGKYPQNPDPEISSVSDHGNRPRYEAGSAKNRIRRFAVYLRQYCARCILRFWCIIGPYHLRRSGCQCILKE